MKKGAEMRPFFLCGLYQYFMCPVCPAYPGLSGLWRAGLLLAALLRISNFVVVTQPVNGSGLVVRDEQTAIG